MIHLATGKTTSRIQQRTAHQKAESRADSPEPVYLRACVQGSEIGPKPGHVHPRGTAAVDICPVVIRLDAGHPIAVELPIVAELNSRQPTTGGEGHRGRINNLMPARCYKCRSRVERVYGNVGICCPSETTISTDIETGPVGDRGRRRRRLDRHIRRTIDGATTSAIGKWRIGLS